MPASSSRRRRGFALIVIAAAIVVATTLFLLPLRSAETTATATYNVPPSMAMTFAAQFATRKLGWKVAEQSPESGKVRLLLPDGQGEITVDARPAGRNTEITLQGHTRSTLFRDPAQPFRDLQAGLDDKLPRSD